MDEYQENRWTKKPVTITAKRERHRFEVRTREGTMVGQPGDWLITGVEGEKYPCADAIFRKTYTLANPNLQGPICTCPATSEYDDPCPRHGVVGIGRMGADMQAIHESPPCEGYNKPAEPQSTASERKPDTRVNLTKIHFEVWPYGDALLVKRSAEADERCDPKHLHGINLYIGTPYRFESVYDAVLHTADQLRSLAHLATTNAVVKTHAKEIAAPKIGTFDETNGSITGDVIMEFGGACPVQGFGSIHGYPAYYRARGTGWSVEIFEKGVDVHGDESADAIFKFGEFEYAFPDGGWIHRDESIANLRKAAEAFKDFQAKR